MAADRLDPYKKLLAVAWAVGAVATFVLGRALLYPWTDEEIYTPGHFDAMLASYAGFGLGIFAVLAGVARSDSRRRRIATLLVLVATGPLVVLALQGRVADDHRDQDALLGAFDGYTARFSERLLDSRLIHTRAGNLGTVCALEREPGADEAENWLCLHIDGDLPAGRRVEGAYRAEIPPAELSYRGPGLAYECWGRSKREGECDWLKEVER